MSVPVDHLRSNGMGQTSSTPPTIQLQNTMTYFLKLLTSFRAAAGFAPASKPSAEDEAKAAAAQSVLIAASRTRHPLTIAAN